MSSCSPGWPQTFCVVEEDRIPDLHASISHVLGLQMCTPHPAGLSAQLSQSIGHSAFRLYQVCQSLRSITFSTVLGVVLDLTVFLTFQNSNFILLTVTFRLYYMIPLNFQVFVLVFLLTFGSYEKQHIIKKFMIGLIKLGNFQGAVCFEPFLFLLLVYCIAQAFT